MFIVLLHSFILQILSTYYSTALGARETVVSKPFLNEGRYCLSFLETSKIREPVNHWYCCCLFVFLFANFVKFLGSSLHCDCAHLIGL